MEANDFEGRGYALNATIAIPRGGDGQTTLTIFANTPVAIVGIVAILVLGCAMLTQEHWRPQGSELALTEGDGDRSEALS